jgi:galactose mutarotase-like enzyme
MEINATTYHGLQALELRDEALKLVILPEWGGKIASLVDLRRGREWLHTNPHFAFQLPVYAADYVGGYDIGGFDECFPNVGAGLYPTWPWEGVALPDHGEVWALPWEADLAGNALDLGVHGARLPYRLEKNLRLLGGGRLRLDYRLTSLAPMDMPFVWSSHPLLDIRPGMRLEVPAEMVRVDSASPGFPAQAGELISWPIFEGRDLSLVPGPDTGLALKLIARSLAEGRAALSDPQDGARFEFIFDPGRVTHVGLWLNYGGWAGLPGVSPYYNLGFEPCIGVADRLDLALEAHECGLLPAEGELTWWLELAVQ